MKHHILRVIALIAGLGALGAARADVRQELPQYDLPRMYAAERLAWDGAGREEKRQEGRQLWAALPPEQRQQMRQQMREHWQQMPPEQREMRRQEYRERWQQMPSDERQRIRDEMREQRGYGEDHRWNRR